MVAAVTTQAKTHLHAVHFILADDLDGTLAWVLAGSIARAVDVAEGTVAHLFDQLPSLQAGISREFALALVLLSYKLGQVCVVDVLAGLGRLVLVRLGGMGGCVVCLGGAVLTIASD